jgi:hypothetical protein
MSDETTVGQAGVWWEQRRAGADYKPPRSLVRDRTRLAAFSDPGIVAKSTSFVAFASCTAPSYRVIKQSGRAWWGKRPGGIKAARPWVKLLLKHSQITKYGFLYQWQIGD